MAAQKLSRFFKNNNSIVTLAVIVAYALFFVPYFNLPKNISNVLVDSSVYGIACIGMTFCLLTGGVDLSLGFQVAASACIMCYVGSQTNLFLGIVAAVAFCVVVGFVNGYVVSKMGLGSLITTLATMRVLYGFILVITHENQIVNTNAVLTQIYKFRLFGAIQLPIVIFAVCILAAAFILRKTRLGTSLYIIGGNAEAGRVVGINVDRVRIVAYMLTSFFAGICGVVLAARFGMGSTIIGDGLNLTVVSACVVGGVSILGGKGSMSRMLLGILIMRIIINVMVLKNINGYMQSFVQGIIIVLVLIVDLVTSFKKSTTH